MKTLLFKARTAAKKIPEGLSEEDNFKYAILSVALILMKLMMDIALEYMRNR
jgi:hypothetical protein